MGTVRYTTINGEVIAQKRDGVRKQFVPDPLGSTVAMLDNAQTITDTFSYWPYGETASRTGDTVTPLQYVGTLGYYQDASTRNYVRARNLDTLTGRWTTQDPIGFVDDRNVYRAVKNNPVSRIDPSGLGSYCDSCAQKPGLPPPDWPAPWIDEAIDKAIAKYCGGGKCPNITHKSMLCQIWTESSGNDGATTGDNHGILQISKDIWTNYKCDGPYAPEDPLKSIDCAIKALCTMKKSKKSIGFNCNQGETGWGTHTHGSLFQCCMTCFGCGYFPQH